MMILALAAEVSALRERLDTHEQLAAGGRQPTPDATEGYRPTEAVEAVRAAARRELIDRITRVLLEPRSVRGGGGPDDDQTEETRDAAVPTPDADRGDAR
jgi:hypothetical protein